MSEPAITMGSPYRYRTPCNEAGTPIGPTLVDEEHRKGLGLHFAKRAIAAGIRLYEPEDLPGLYADSAMRRYARENAPTAVIAQQGGRIVDMRVEQRNKQMKTTPS